MKNLPGSYSGMFCGEDTGKCWEKYLWMMLQKSNGEWVWNKQIALTDSFISITEFLFLKFIFFIRSNCLMKY